MKKTKILTIANRKGGAGKSTCAAHIAIEAVKRGLKVILFDLDPQKTLEIWWNQREETNPSMSDVEACNIEKTIESLSNHDFDLCIIDTPGDMSSNAEAGLKVADLVLIPSKPTAPDLQAIGRTIGALKTFKKNWVFVITQVVQQAKSAGQAASVLSSFGVVSPSSLGNRVSYGRAMQIGDSAANIDKEAKIEIEELWDFINSKLFSEVIKDAKENGKKKVRLKL